MAFASTHLDHMTVSVVPDILEKIAKKMSTSAFLCPARMVQHAETKLMTLSAYVHLDMKANSVMLTLMNVNRILVVKDQPVWTWLLTVSQNKHF
jgi:hypothetical protein